MCITARITSNAISQWCWETSYWTLGQPGLVLVLGCGFLDQICKRAVSEYSCTGLAGASREDKEAALKAEQSAKETASPSAPVNGKRMASDAAEKPNNAATPSDAAVRPKTVA